MEVFSQITYSCTPYGKQITATGGSSYNWNTGETTAANTVSPSSTTVYSCIASNGACQDATPFSTQVNVIPGETAIAKPTSVALSTGGVVNFSSSGSIATVFN